MTETCGGGVGEGGSLLHPRRRFLQTQFKCSRVWVCVLWVWGAELEGVTGMKMVAAVS